MDWLNCNRCSLKYSPEIKLYLVECGHIFCERCIQTIKSKTCIICNRKGSILLINKEMNKTVMEFFMPMEMFCKRAVEVSKFQLTQRSIYLQNLHKKYSLAKQEIVKLDKSHKALIKDNQMLCALLRSAGKNVPKNIIPNTPASLASNFTFLNATGSTDDAPLKSSMMPKFRIPGQAKRIVPGKRVSKPMLNVSGGAGTAPVSTSTPRFRIPQEKTSMETPHSEYWTPSPVQRVPVRVHQRENQASVHAYQKHFSSQRH